MRWRRALPAAFLLLVLDTLGWSLLEQRLQRSVARMTRTAAAAGWLIQADAPRRGGWPSAATLTFAAARITGPAARITGLDGLLQHGIDWSGRHIVVSLSPWHPRQISIMVQGTETVALSQLGSIRVWAQRVALRVPTRPGSHEARFDADILHLARQGVGSDDVLPGGLSVAALHARLRWINQPVRAQALDLALEDVALPRHGDGADPVIPHAKLDASLSGPPDRLLLRQAELSWPDASLTLSGDASLPGGGRCASIADGAFSLRIVGWDTLLERATASGRLDAAHAAAIRAVLSLIAAGRGAAEDPRAQSFRETQSLELPLALRGGLLSLGSIPLLRLSEPVGAESP